MNKILRSYCKKNSIIHTHDDVLSFHLRYCGSGNFREVLIFANFARKTNLRILKSRENYYYNIATKKMKISEF